MTRFIRLYLEWPDGRKAYLADDYESSGLNKEICPEDEQMRLNRAPTLFDIDEFQIKGHTPA